MDAPTAVLLVEDEPNLRDAFTRILTMAGFRVTAVGRGSEALDLLDRIGEFTVLVTDIRLPDMYGRRLAERIVEQQPGLRVLYMSGDVQEIARQPIDAPTERFIGKPFDLDDFVRVVRELDAEARAAARER